MKKLFFGLLVLAAGTLQAQVRTASLLCEFKPDPVGVESTQPRLSWQLRSDRRNTVQSAYEIRVAGSPDALRAGRNLTWSSGRVASDQSVGVRYGGPAPEPGATYYWQVRVWDGSGKASAWSAPARWQMGLLQPAAWKASWIGNGSPEDPGERPSPYFRKEFSLPRKVRSATAFITAHGLYEAFINGRRVGDAYLTPGWTAYQKRLQYQQYDVTPLLQAGSNAVGVMLGNGWFRGNLAWEGNRDVYGKELSLLFQLDITYEDGSREQVVSDGSWTTSTGAIRYNDLYNGERQDSRKIPEGWDKPGFAAAGWTPAQVRNLPKEHLVATYNEPVRKKETFRALRLFRTPKGELVADFGQNLVGWVQLRLSGNTGDSIVLHHAEVLDKEGNFYTANLRTAKQENIYILKGGGEELLEPHFTFQGFRYIRISGFPGALKPEQLTAVALYSDMPSTGNFTTNHALLNQLQHNIRWGQNGNFVDVPTDCPQRDERLGWTGDAQVFARTASFNRNVHPFFTKWLKDLAADQLSSGVVPPVIPNVLKENAAGSAGWADAATIIPWTMYLAYGDTALLEDQYPSMKGWVDYMRANSNQHLWNKGFHFGDWLFYRPDDDLDGRSAITDKYLIAQAFFAHSAGILSKTAALLGKKEDAAFYRQLQEEVKQAFLKEYVTPSGRLVSSSQTAYVLALHFDMLPDTLRPQAAKRLVDNIRSYNNHLTTGFLGTPYLCHVLTRYGYDSVAYQLLLQETYPSWLYPVKMGATTIWERWDGQKRDSTFQNPGMNSFNHYAYGAIGDWMY
ncbi:MAG TPA: family 78 glycoside hydrolase catalytic domain, partial [Chitinophagaceae bacterium]|nr:family 78 glycoside hydrolase catalytic domain [Chitinophagaceae bacterium]